MGGAALFIIIILLFVMILCVRQFHKKKSRTFNNGMVTGMNSNIKMNTNPSYSIIKQNGRQEDEYDDVLCDKITFQDNTEDTLKMESNPSYGGVQGCNAFDAGCDVSIQSNPSDSSISKETNMMYKQEDEDGYINSLSMQKADYFMLTGSTTKEEESVYDVATDDTDNVKINLNPSYDSVLGGVKLEDNPSYNKIKHT